jgi:hypothetical protein
VLESDARTIAALRKWSVLLDSAFRVPGTRLTFGLDPIIGLIPGLGDLTTPVFAAILLLHAVRLRIPKVVQLRMLINAIIDLAVGLIPFVGDFFDFGLKANVRNLALLERYAQPGATAGRGDWMFVLAVIGALAALAIVPFLLAAWLLSRFQLF